MTAIADFNTLRNALAAPHQRRWFTKASVASQAAGGLTSLWLATPDAGTAPTTAAVPTNATAGALIKQVNAANQLWLARGEGKSSQFYGSLFIIDRLSHQGGLSAIVTGAQTTNLPTAALTRYTSGVGVMAGLEIYTAIGTTATTITCSYTNSAGTAGQVTPAMAFGGASPASAASRFFPLSLAAGDLGVRSVENVNILASTLTAGAFGVTLYKPLMMFPLILEAQQAWRDGFLSGSIAEILANACLSALVLPYSTSTSLISYGFDMIDV